MGNNISLNIQGFILMVTLSVQVPIESNLTGIIAILMLIGLFIVEFVLTINKMIYFICLGRNYECSRKIAF